MFQVLPTHRVLLYFEHTLRESEIPAIDNHQNHYPGTHLKFHRMMIKTI